MNQHLFLSPESLSTVLSEIYQKPCKVSFNEELELDIIQSDDEQINDTDLEDSLDEIGKRFHMLMNGYEVVELEEHGIGYLFYFQ